MYFFELFIINDSFEEIAGLRSIQYLKKLSTLTFSKHKP